MSGLLTTEGRAVEPVHVTEGLLAGALANEHGVRVFKGIPYAAPPTGARRWSAPQPPPSWTGVRAVDRFGPACLQTRMFAEVGPRTAPMSEDCLYLNVWTPARDASDKLPVLVWFHGGAYVIGSGSEPGQDPTRLAGKGLVVVTLNYRLGVFGFLSHPWLAAEAPFHASGNYGLMDQIEALRWVKRNIAAFGGDPERVTIAGHSAGSTTVNILMAAPLAKGLFQRAIGQSGSAMPASGPGDGSPLPADIEERKGVHFARSLAVRNLEELRALPAEAVLQAGGAHYGDWAWNASVDGYVLPAPPATIFAQGQQNDVPLLVGWNTHEGASLGLSTFGGDSESFREQASAHFGEHASEVLKLYSADSPAQERAAKVALAGEGFISYPSWTWARAQVRFGRAPVFVYTFGYRPPFPSSWMRGATLGDPGAYHGASTIYVFGNFERHPEWRFTAADRELSELLQTYWANFARAGNPNGAGLPSWPPYTADARAKKLYILQTGVGAAVDREAHRFEALGRLLQSSPGSLVYRGMNPQRWGASAPN
jgi:para-nitrobenzyl esterase